MRKPFVAAGALALAFVAAQSGARGDPLDPLPTGGGIGAHGAQSMELQKLAIRPLLADKVPNAVPAGVSPSFWSVLVPEANVGNDVRVALGRRLYFDPRLSADGTVACATCHDVSRGFTDRRSTSEGIRDQVGRRNAPTTLNAVFFTTQFWDGRAATLEDQAKLPIVNPIEMGQPNGSAAAAAIAGDADYQAAFRAAYGHAVNYDDIGRAIAAFERTLVFVDAAFDRFLDGDSHAISDDARTGWALFMGKARCVSCHQFNGSEPIFTDNRFHNIGVSARTKDFEKLARAGLDALANDRSADAIDRLAIQTDLAELGRFAVTHDRADIGAFKTQQLRNIALTAPYMHDGSLPTLWDVMDHYNKGGEANPYLDGAIEPLDLNETEINQLVAFLFTLTDDRFAAQNAPELERQRRLASHRPQRDEALATRKVFLFERRATGAISTTPNGSPAGVSPATGTRGR
jgi:cytochrome c peroxidase